MNYYEKIIQEKMNSTQVVEKGTIKGAEYFIEKVTETVKYPRPFEQVRYIGKLKKDGRVIIYTPRHENLDTCKRALDKLVDENKSMFNNSKGETNMGYYADLIKQKQEKRNSAESHLKGLIGKKFKRDTDLERAVNGSIYTEISDWSHPRMVVFDKYTDEKYILTTEDNNKYGKDQEFWISKVQKVNEKEEKDNADSAYVEALQKAERIINRMFQSRDKKEARAFLQKIGWNVSTLGEDPADYARAIRRAVRNYPEKSAEILSNEKEEKDNAIPSGKRIDFDDDIVAVYNPQGKVIYKGLEDYDPHKRDDWRWDGSKGYYTNPDHPGFVKVCFRNEKEEKDNSLIGLFEDLRQKDEKTVKEYIRQVKNFIRQCEAKSERSDYAKDYRDLNKRAAESFKKDVEKAERWLSEHRNSDEEKGYYAKLAEEKKNSSYNIVWDGELYSIDTYKKALFVEVTVKRKYEKEKARLDSDYQRFRSSIEKIISEVPNK